MKRDPLSSVIMPTVPEGPPYCDNPVYKRLRLIYCVAGSEFNRMDLQAAWLEIARLESAVKRLLSEVRALRESIAENHPLERFTGEDWAASL